MVAKDIDYLILKALKKEEGYLSGEELGKKLSLSRQALWKHIAKLVDKGYEIAAVPHLGYRLISSPDRLYPWEVKDSLKTKFIAKNIHYFEVVDSTQDIAWQLGLKGYPEGTLAVSERQTKGRGRLKRKWISGAGGLYASLIIRPDILISEIPQITLLIGLACVRGIKEAAGFSCLLKWPNDILLSGKKLGGILSEINAEQDKVNFIILGIGININTKDLPAQATSLFLAAKKRFHRARILRGILEEAEELYRRVKKEGFSFVRKEWAKVSYLCGKRISVKVMDREVEGEAMGVDEGGYLLLRRDNGFVERISAADSVKLNVN